MPIPKLSRRVFLRQMILASGALLPFHFPFPLDQRDQPSQHYQVALAADPVTYTLRLLHTNDHHSWIEPSTVTLSTQSETDIRREFGGVARLKTIIDDIRANALPNENLLLLDSGDVFQGTLYFTQFNGQADLYFYNRLGYDAVTLGNHEFDKGQTPIRDFILGANFPMLSANIEVQPTAILAAAMAPTDLAVAGKLGKQVILTRGDRNIGIFGLTPPKTNTLSAVGAGVTFNASLAKIAQAQVDALRLAGAHYVIGLTHIGFNSDIQLAAQVRGLDAIIGGHSHTPLLPATNTAPLGVESGGLYPTMVTNPDGKAVLVATAWKWGRWLGDTTLGFSANGALVSVNGTIHPIWAGGLGSPKRSLLPGEEAEIVPDAAFQTQIDTVYKPPLQALEAQVIGRAAITLNGDRVDVRNCETTLGNVVADAMLKRTQEDGAQIALLNSGSIGRSIPTGDVTLAELIEALPFDNSLARVDLTGAQLLDALENAVSLVDFVNPNNSSGRFAQVSGLHFTWAPNAIIGRRILSVYLQAPGASTATPLDLAATYQVVTNNFMLGGGDGYAVFPQGKNQADTGILLVEMMTDYFAAHSPVSSAVQGRIVSATTLSLPQLLE